MHQCSTQQTCYFDQDVDQHVIDITYFPECSLSLELDLEINVKIIITYFSLNEVSWVPSSSTIHRGNDIIFTEEIM